AKENYRAQVTLSEGAKSPRVAAIGRKIDQLLDEWKEIEAKIRLTSPAWSALHIPEAVNARYVQTKLVDAGTALIEYHLGTEHSYAWVIDRKRVSVHPLPPRDAIERLSRRYHELLSRDVDAMSGADREKNRREIAAAGHKLAAAVWKPVAARATQTRLLIVPDGALDYVPFSA